MVLKVANYDQSSTNIFSDKLLFSNKKMDFAILSSICIYLMLISVYVLRGFYQCCHCAAQPKSQDRLENGLLEMVPVESTALELEDQIHEELP